MHHWHGGECQRSKGKGNLCLRLTVQASWYEIDDTIYRGPGIKQVTEKMKNKSENHFELLKNYPNQKLHDLLDCESKLFTKIKRLNTN